MDENGVPKCDYTRFRAVHTNPKRRLAEAVKRLISILRMQKQKRLNFTDLVNVLKDRQLAMDISNSLLTSESEAANIATRRLSVNLLKVSNQLKKLNWLQERMGERNDGRIKQKYV